MSTPWCGLKISGGPAARRLENYSRQKRKRRAKVAGKEADEKKVDGKKMPEKDA
jgi:hypothetical protein